MADAAAAAAPRIAHGHHRGAFDYALKRQVADAAGSCERKLMRTAPDGTHCEYRLPPGGQIPAIDGTYCHLNLESRAPELANGLKPGNVDAFTIDRVNLYVTRGRGGARLHFDTRDVIVVQIAGAKLWRFSERPAVANPHRTFLAPADAGIARYGAAVIAVPTRLHAIVLQPGDWLMLPRAHWHETFTNIGSVSATLAGPAPLGEL